MTFDLATIARVIKAEAAPPPIAVSGWSVDTRTQNVGDLFFALRGPNHDGHDHVPVAVRKGSAVVVARPTGAPLELRVPDTLAALQTLAAWARRQWGGTVVAVTGSAGKTTTKDAIAHLLAARIPTGKTVGNFNNHVGVPLSILRLPEDCRAAVIEMGMNHAGEIRALAAIARPDIGVVTNVGYAHVECFGSIGGVALAKRELIEGLHAGGTAVLNADDPRVAAFRGAHSGPVVTYGFSEGADVRAEDAELGPEGSRFRVDGVRFQTPLPGRHAVLNFLAALAVARVFGVPFDCLPPAVAAFTAGTMRGERLERGGITVWNDCYNANPEAMRAMLDVLAATPAARRIAVLGEMLELGECAPALHAEVGRHAARVGINVLIAVGGAARHILDGAAEAGMSNGALHSFEEAAGAGAFARALARSGDALLFKGSRGVRMERALEEFMK